MKLREWIEENVNLWACNDYDGIEEVINDYIKDHKMTEIKDLKPEDVIATIGGKKVDVTRFEYDEKNGGYIFEYKE